MKDQERDLTRDSEGPAPQLASFLEPSLLLTCPQNRTGGAKPTRAALTVSFGNYEGKKPRLGAENGSLPLFPTSVETCRAEEVEGRWNSGEAIYAGDETGQPASGDAHTAPQATKS